MRRVFAAIVIGLFAPPLSTALAKEGASGGSGIDCRGAASEVVRAICASPEVAKAEAEMADAFKALHDVIGPEQKERLLKDQLSWLDRRTRGCGGYLGREEHITPGCFRAGASQRARILRRALQRLQEGTRAPESPTFRQEATALCEEVARLTNEGRIEERFVPMRKPSVEERETALSDRGQVTLEVADFDADDGTKQRFVSIYPGGSCASSFIQRFDDMHGLGSLQATDKRSVVSDDLPGDLEMGTDDILLRVRNQTLMVTGSKTYIRMLSGWGQSRQERLCTFRPTGQVIMRVAQNAPPVCQKIASGALRPLSWAGKDDEDTESELEPVLDGFKVGGGSPGEPTLVATVKGSDAALRGRSRIGLIYLDYFNGCGRREEFLALAMPFGRGKQATRLSLSLTKITGPLHSWGGLTDWDTDGDEDNFNEPGSLSVYSYDKRLYALGRYKGRTGIYSIDEGGIHKTCDVDLLPQIEVERMYVAQ